MGSGKIHWGHVIWANGKMALSGLKKLEKDILDMEESMHKSSAASSLWEVSNSV